LKTYRNGPPMPIVTGVVCLDQRATCPAEIAAKPSQLEAARQIGADGIVSKRAGSVYSGGSSREWLKTKVSETAAFVITGYIEGEAVSRSPSGATACWCPPLVKFGLGVKDLWQRLEPLRAGPASRGGLVPVRPELVVGVKYFGRYRTGAIRDGV
jgi:ATP-dependent DNA ligase